MKYKALVRFLSSKEGGRLSAPVSGYKPQLKIGKEHTSCIVSLENPSRGKMDFGIKHVVFIELQFEDLYPEKTFLKNKIELYEGSKLVGVGKFLYD